MIVMTAKEGEAVVIESKGDCSARDIRAEAQLSLVDHDDEKFTVPIIVPRSSPRRRRIPPHWKRRRSLSTSRRSLSSTVLFIAVLVYDMMLPIMHTTTGFVLKQPKPFGMVSSSDDGQKTLDTTTNTKNNNNSPASTLLNRFVLVENTVELKPEETKFERSGDRAVVSISISNDDDLYSRNNTDSSGVADADAGADDDEEEENYDQDTRQKIAAARTSLLLRRSSRNFQSKIPGRETSLGPRRMVVQGGARATTKITDAIRKTAGVAAASSKKKETRRENDIPRKSAQVTKSIIQIAIEDILRNRSPSLSSGDGAANTTTTTATANPPPPTTAAFSSFAPHVGVLGSRTEKEYVEDDDESSSLLRPGSVVLGPTSSWWKDGNDKAITVRIATHADDVDVASLRLSVFSELTPDIQNQFHGRSCQALHSRRLRGAICLVARAAAPSPCNQPNSYEEEDGSLLGSAECSFHEFFGTRLGRRRPRNSVLYVTEVAVNPAARRQGIGRKLLRAIDLVATMRGTETLYLHVDATNLGALALYEKAGYRKASLDDAVFMEFTTSLNLQPGATKGRDHFLLYKDLMSSPTWLDEDDAADISSTCSAQKTILGTLGFEIPA